jgi:negative regulator of sigma-B (phosphoserine phosphatase)
VDERGLIEWQAAERTIAGEEESGDVPLVAPFSGGVLVAALDGLGHGPEAVRASRRAVEILSEEPGASPFDLVQRCHQGLRRTRGVVLSLASFDSRADTLTWVGVGNVEARLVRTDAEAGPESLVLMPGIVGYKNLPSLRVSSLAVYPGDLLVMATDGIRGMFIGSIDASLSPRAIADLIMTTHVKPNDDALVLVVRYRGAGQ